MANLRCPVKKNARGGKRTVNTSWCIENCDLSETCEALRKKLGRNSAPKRTTDTDNKIISVKEREEVILLACARCYEVINKLDKFCPQCGQKL